MTDFTQNLNLAKPAFDQRQWQDLVNENFDVLDALWAKYFATTGLVGVWKNAAAYTVNQLVVDETLGSIWRCEVAHTSPSSGTFLASRTANPTYWSNYTIGVRYKGAWSSAATYAIGDFVVANSSYFAVANIAHTAGSAFSTSGGVWEILIDTSSAVSAINASVSSAGTYATAAGVSASAAGTYATAAGTFATQAGVYASSAASAAATATAGAIWCGTAGGTANAISLTAATATAVSDGLQLRFRVASTNTGSVTVATTGGIAATALVDALGNALIGNELIAGEDVSIVYDNTRAAFCFYGVAAIIVGKHAMPVSADAMQSRTSSGATTFSTQAATNLQMLTGLLFGSTAASYAQFGVPAPYSVSTAGVITYRAIWTATQGTTAATCIWQLAAVGIGDGDALDVAFGTAVDNTDLFLGTLKNHISPESGDVTISSFARGDEIRFQVNRKISGNTLVADAVLRWIVIFFNLDKTSDRQ